MFWEFRIPDLHISSANQQLAFVHMCAPEFGLVDIRSCSLENSEQAEMRV